LAILSFIGTKNAVKFDTEFQFTCTMIDTGAHKRARVGAGRRGSA